LITYLGKTAEDKPLVDWVAGHCSYPNSTVVISHGGRERARVKPNDLVNSQGYLPDGRLVRLDTASPCHRGDKMGVFVTAEPPSEESPQ
jgi:hypothetical protein